jgi:hypothetical protein
MLILTTAITIALVIERITFACVSLFFYIFGVGPDRKSVWFVSGLVQNASNTTSAFSNAIFRLFSFSVRSLLWCIIALVIWGVLYIAMRYSADGLVALQRGYNSDVGGAVRLAIAIPLQLVQLLWDGIVPLWNLGVYCMKTIPSRVLFENVLRNMGDFKESIIHLAYFMEKLALSLFAYIKIIISPPDSFDPNLRLLDLVTPLSEWRLAVSYMLTFVGDMCAVATSLLDVLMYPFLDINFGLGVHNIVNSLLTLLIHVPAVTIDRCSAGGGPVVYCLPDFEPVIELAVHGIRNFGLLVDNWLDVTMIIIQSVLTATSPACTGWTVVDFNKGGQLMGINETVIVGVASNLFAKTDGWNVELYTRTTTTSLPGAFPLAMNVNYGIASVSASVDTRGLLGCTCSDQDYGMQIVCAVAPLDTLTPSYFVPVEFRVPTTSFFMGCGRSKIKLDSIRWPATRYTSPNSRATSAPMTEAALWVRPACGSEWIDVACVETFKLAGCFPYCMALWTKGYTGSMILRSASEWQNSVAMMNRDCGLHTWDLKSGDMADVTAKLIHNSGVKSTWMDAEVQLNGTHCVYAPNTFSRMIRNNTDKAYASYRSVAITGQPFAFAGDLALTAVNTVGDTWGIDVQRVWGNQVRVIDTCAYTFHAIIASWTHCSGVHTNCLFSDQAPEFALLVLRHRTNPLHKLHALVQSLERKFSPLTIQLHLIARQIDLRLALRNASVLLAVVVAERSEWRARETKRYRS